jgi:hypothetical protein
MAKSRKYEDRLPIGDAIVEFYSALDMIEEYYAKKGYRKITMLHKVLKEKLGWKMPYDTFRYHFNKEFGSRAKSKPLNKDLKDEVVKNITVAHQSPDADQKQTPKENRSAYGPIILDPAKRNEKKIYNGSTKNIKRDEI